MFCDIMLLNVIECFFRKEVKNDTKNKRKSYAVLCNVHCGVMGRSWFFDELQDAGREPLKSKLGGKVPVVIVDHKGNRDEDIYGTITHNRARGTHLLEPMKNIVKELMASGKSIPEISKQLGMKPEEIFRLSDFTRDDFLKMLIGDHTAYSKSYIVKDV